MPEPTDPPPDPSLASEAVNRSKDASDSDRSRQLPVIGLMGAPGSGKSTVAAVWGDAGCLVIDSDAIARTILGSPEAAITLSSWWGDDVLDDDKRVDRAAVARKVFADDPSRKRLEAWVHPKVHQERRRRREEIAPGTRAIVEDAPLLIEAGIDDMCNVLVFVEAGYSDRLERVVATRGWTPEQLNARESAQAELSIKRERAHHILLNDADLKTLKARAEALLSKICMQHGA